MSNYTAHVILCQYNSGVSCEDYINWSENPLSGPNPCKTCGWNPAVEYERRKAINKKFDIRPYGERLELLYKQYKLGLISRAQAISGFNDICEEVFGKCEDDRKKTKK